ncbi:MAG: VWA domain-containing protein [Terracidiphilus sp.]
MRIGKVTVKQIAGGSLLCAGLLLVLAAPRRPAAQDNSGRLHLNVDLVELNVAVTDRKGNYVSGLRPQDFRITEDKIPEKIASFDEGGAPVNGSQSDSEADQAGNAGSGAEASAPPALASAGLANLPATRPIGANVFVLFDTSNYMYRGFVYAQDAITDFVRSMAAEDNIAFYSYSRDLSRGALLTTDRFNLVRGVRSTVAGDDAALYNCLLLTVEDAASLRGRKAIVVFSNGPDNASSIPPEDVAELAQSTGTIIYIISTSAAQNEPVSTAAFERMSKATGGKAYFARNWRDEHQAFSSIKEDLGHLYTLSYYPKPNPNRGWRAIKVELVGKNLQKYRIRTRDGYSLQQVNGTGPSYASTASQSDPEY